MEDACYKEEKRRLRRRIREYLSGLSREERQDSDRALLQGFLTLPQVQSANTILLYYGVGYEPDTKQLLLPLLSAGKKVALPRILPNWQMEARLVDNLAETSLLAGGLDIPEPSREAVLLLPHEIDLILVPAMCCDEEGYRLGQGGGYYDRYLRAYQGVTVAFCREILLQRKLPRDPHDLPVQHVITEAGELVLLGNRSKAGGFPPPLPDERIDLGTGC